MNDCFGMLQHCKRVVDDWRLWAVRNRLSVRRLLKVTFINLLDVQNVLVAAADIVLDHQFGELRAVNKHDPRT